MLEELFNLVKGTAQADVVNNPDIPDEHNDQVIAEATDTVASGLRNMVAGGGVQNVLSLFTNKSGGSNAGSDLLNNPIVNMMIGHFAGKLMNKFSLGGTQANSVASSLIPSVISSLVNKTNDPGETGFSLEKLLNSITGGKLDSISQGNSGGGGTDIAGLIKQFTGGSDAGGQEGGLMDIVSQLAGGAQAEQQRNGGGGGLMDIIKGFIK